MSNEPARPIDISNIMSHRGLSLLNSVRLTFELIENHKKVSQLEYATITAAIANHLRSCDPMASQTVASVEMPVVSSPVIAKTVEPLPLVSRMIHDGDEYEIKTSAGAVVLVIHDREGDIAVLSFEPSQGETFVDDFTRVLAVVRR